MALKQNIGSCFPGTGTTWPYPIELSFITKECLCPLPQHIPQRRAGNVGEEGVVQVRL